MENVMKKQQPRAPVFSLLLIIGLCQVARADILDVLLTNSDLTGAPGSSLAVFATISNPSTTDTVYLNGDSSTTVSTFLTVDDTPFFNNAPFFLDPGANTGTTPFELFDVIIDPNTPAGVYSDNLFSILGGPDGGTFSDYSDLSDSYFNVTVTASTPEPNAFWLLLTVLVISGLGRSKRKVLTFRTSPIPPKRTPGY
jgi:hypothetical protein